MPDTFENLSASLVVDFVTGAVAVAALILGVFNYRQAKRRDSFHLAAAVQPELTHHPDGRREATLLAVEVTNTGQRPVTVIAVAIVWSRSGWRNRFSRQRRFWRRRRMYQWHRSIGVDGIRLDENRPRRLHWDWASIGRILRDWDLGEHPRLEGIQLSLGLAEGEFIRAQNAKAVEEVATQILAGIVTARSI